jgi:hypothetical protein
MAEEAKKTQEERIKELEAEVASLRASQHTSTRHSNRVADSLSDTSRNKLDLGGRAVRGVTLASLEGVRLIADTVSTFADGVISRNHPRGDETLSESVTRIPGDMIESASEAFDKLVDIPSRTADKYSEVYREGDRTTSRRRASSHAN